MKKNMQGFTLIELMVVFGIIAILAAISMPIYQDYSVKTQAAAALAEIAPGKTGFELAVTNNLSPTTTATDAGYINILGETRYCKVTADKAKGITCTGINGVADKFNGRTITLVRSGDGIWSCSTNLEAKAAPSGCTVTK